MKTVRIITDFSDCAKIPAILKEVNSDTVVAYQIDMTSFLLVLQNPNDLVELRVKFMKEFNGVTIRHINN